MLLYFRLAFDSKAIEVIDRDAQGTLQGSLMITVYCIADKVFVQDPNGTLTQVMDSRFGGTIFAMTCKDYKQKMKK